MGIERRPVMPAISPLDHRLQTRRVFVAVASPVGNKSPSSFSRSATADAPVAHGQRDGIATAGRLVTTVSRARIVGGWVAGEGERVVQVVDAQGRYTVGVVSRERACGGGGGGGGGARRTFRRTKIRMRASATKNSYYIAGLTCDEGINNTHAVLSGME